MRRLLTAVIALAALAAVGVLAVDAANPPQTYTIEASYAFDVSDPAQLAGFADQVFIGRVVDGGTAVEVDEQVFTDFRVRVDGAPMKGQLPEQVTVRQIGGTSGEDTWTLQDQPLLVPGKSYLLVTGNEPGQQQLGLVSGPISAQRLGDDADRQAAIDDWTRAVRDQRVPEALR